MYAPSSLPSSTLDRRRLLLAALAAAALPIAGRARAAGAVPIEVWKAPSCGCCKDWVKHLGANGFKATVHEDGNTDVRQRLGIPVQLGSCHTALVQGYAIEGHVPAREIQRLLKDKPVAIGLSAPGMPVGAPGMDGPEYGGRKDRFDVLLVRKDGSSSVYQTYG